MILALYEEYLKELEKYTEPFPKGTGKDALDFYHSLRHCHEQKLIFHEGKLVGFLIVGWTPDCHPDCDYFICQAYLKPEVRRKGLMKEAVDKFVNGHPGVYCLDVLFNNHSAHWYWAKRFKELGYIQTSLPFCEHGVTGVCETLFFRREICK